VFGRVRLSQGASGWRLYDVLCRGSGKLADVIVAVGAGSPEKLSKKNCDL